MRRFCFSLVAADRGCGGGGAMRTGKGTYPRGESQLADSTPPQHFTAVGAKRASRQRGRVEAAAAMGTWHTTSRRKRCAFKRTRPCLLRSPRLIVGGGRTTVQAAGEEAARVGRREATRRDGRRRRMGREGSEVGVRRREYCGGGLGTHAACRRSSRRSRPDQRKAEHQHEHGHTPRQRPRAAGDEQFDSLRGVAGSGPCGSRQQRWAPGGQGSPDENGSGERAGGRRRGRRGAQAG